MPGKRRTAPCSAVHGQACLALLAAAASAVLLPAFPAQGQELRDERRGAIVLRGTQGSGETDIDFDSGDLLEETSQTQADGGARNGSAGRLAVPEPRPRPPAQEGPARPAQPEPQVLDTVQTGTPSPRGNLAAVPEQSGTGTVQREDPFAPEGLRIGSWRANVTLDQGIGYSTNLTETASRNPSAFSETRLSVSARSDWSRHEASIDAQGSYRRSLGNDLQEFPAGSVNAGLRLDLADGMTARFGANYSYETEAVTSTNLPATVENRPGVHSFGGSAELERSDRKLGFRLRGVALRTLHEDAELAGGGSFDQADRDNTFYAISGRVSYEATPVFTPFIEGEAGLRDLDLETDRNGEDRDSTVFALRAGTGLDFGEKLNGEIAVGYRVEDYEDAALDSLAGWTVDGNLVWSPRRGTTVTLNNTTEFAGATAAGDNGQIINSTTLSALRDVNDRLTLEARAGLELTREDSGGITDRLWSAGAGLVYWLNRRAALTLDLDHQTRASGNGGNSFDATSVRAGVRLQR